MRRYVVTPLPPFLYGVLFAIACFMRIAFGGACLGLRLCALILTIVWEINLTTNRINHIALLYLSTLATRTDAATSCPIDAAQQNVFPVTARRYPSRVRRAGVVSGGVVSEQDPSLRTDARTPCHHGSLWLSVSYVADVSFSRA